MSDVATATETRPRSLGEARWLALDPEPVLAFLHRPPESTPRRCAVLICAPFGWDETCSYRARRTWADELARAGHLVARFDLPGGGDSGGGPHDADLTTRWRDAVADVAGWLSVQADGHRVVALGIGLGGLLAAQALTMGAPIDDLILWAVPDTGRRLVREIRAQAEVVAGRNPADRRDPGDGSLESVGFVLSSETIAALQAVRLSELAWPDGAGRRALLLSRGSLAADASTGDALRRAGFAVTLAAGSGYDELMLAPQEAVTPAQTIATTAEWLAEAPTRSPLAPSPRPTVAELGEVVLGGAVRETPLTFELGSGRLFGVLSEPVEGEPVDVCAVLLNSGAIRRIGPSRLWVELARRWAAEGVSVLRVDLEAIGDSDGDDLRYHRTNDAFFTDDMYGQVSGVLDALIARGLPDRFALAGLCAGADWALHLARAEPRVAATLMVNPAAIFWDPAILAANDRRKIATSLRGRVWRRIARGDLRLAEIRGFARDMFDAWRSRRRSTGDDVDAGSIPGSRTGTVAEMRDRVDAVLDQLRDHGTELLFLVGEMEGIETQFTAHDRIARLSRWPNLRWERLPTRDHMFRAVWLQQIVEDRFDAALQRLIAPPRP